MQNYDPQLGVVVKPPFPSHSSKLSKKWLRGTAQVKTARVSNAGNAQWDKQPREKLWKANPTQASSLRVDWCRQHNGPLHRNPRSNGIGSNNGRTRPEKPYGLNKRKPPLGAVLLPKSPTSIYRFTTDGVKVTRPRSNLTHSKPSIKCPNGNGKRRMSLPRKCSVINGKNELSDVHS